MKQIPGYGSGYTVPDTFSSRGSNQMQNGQQSIPEGRTVDDYANLIRRYPQYSVGTVRGYEYRYSYDITVRFRIYEVDCECEDENHVPAPSTEVLVIDHLSVANISVQKYNFRQRGRQIPIFFNDPDDLDENDFSNVGVNRSDLEFTLDE